MLALFAAGSTPQAFAHAHQLLLNGEIIAILPQEPDVIHNADPTDGAVEEAVDVACATVLHPLHNLVHRGTPGEFAFDQENNPVDIIIDSPFTCPAP